MHNDGRQGRVRRLRWWMGAALLSALVVTAIFVSPWALRGPDRMASEFLDALIQAPADASRLRLAAHLDDPENPQALLQGLSTNVTLNFLQARQAQGISQDIRVLERRNAGPDYTVTLRVSESSSATVVPRDFIVQLQKAGNGEWRIASLRASE
jgi:hypothetical protein